MRGGCIPAFQAALTRTRPVFRRSHALGVVAGARAFTRCALRAHRVTCTRPHPPDSGGLCHTPGSSSEVVRTVAFLLSEEAAHP